MNHVLSKIVRSTVQIRRKNESACLTHGSPSSLNPWTAKIAGPFEMRGLGTIDGKSIETPVAEVEVRFPSISQIMSDQGVQSRALQEWNATLSHPNSPDVTYTDVRFEICQPGYGDWQAIAGNRWTARIAGTFLVRALATADGEPITARLYPTLVCPRRSR